jgi:hypothetical protein
MVAGRGMDTLATKLTEIAEFLAPHGLAPRGALNLGAGELSAPQIGRAGSLVLIGSIGSSGWPAFASSPEYRDGRPDPLDRWSRRIIDALALACGGAPIYPFEGPPYHQFQTWARRADNVFASPLGLLIHPEFGLWHSYRGALALREAIAIPPLQPLASPCESCSAMPCLGACPVGAFKPGMYDVKRCASHLQTDEGTRCMENGCLARGACPVGRQYAHAPAQARFHMQAFRRARMA